MRRDARPLMVLRTYPNWFYIPAALVFGIFFVVPTLLAFYFSLTRWTLFSATFIGLSNYADFLGDPQLMAGLRNTVIYALLTSSLKVVISLPLAMLLTSRIRLSQLLRGIVFFPVLVSTVAVGITFASLLQPSIGLVNTVLGAIELRRTGSEIQIWQSIQWRWSMCGKVSALQPSYSWLALCRSQPIILRRRGLRAGYG